MVRRHEQATLLGHQRNFASDRSIVAVESRRDLNALIDLVLRGKEVSAGVPAAFNDMKGNSFTGLTSVSLLVGPNKAAVTLKITPAEELSVASEGTVLVVPDSTEGDLTVLVESSNDMVSWSSFLSQNITAGSSPKFYRTRIIKNVSP